MKSGGEKIHTCKDIRDADLQAQCNATFKACAELDGEDYKATCAHQAVSCIDMYLKDAPSYPLKTPIGTNITLSTPASCLSAAVRLTKNFGPLKAFQTAVPDVAPPPIEPEPEPQTEGGDSWVTDEKTRFEVSFDYADFLPETGGDNEFKTTLLARYNGDVRGLKIKLKYSLEEIAYGRYLMRYSITGDKGKTLCEDETIEFETSDSVITDDLVFAITLGEEGNFKRAAEVVIAKR